MKPFPETSRLLGAALVTVSLLMPFIAEAQSRRPGVNELLQAISLIRQDRCDAAVPLLRRSNELGNFKNALWNLGECYVELERPQMAVQVYEQYLEHPRTNARERREASRAIETLRAVLARISVTANVEGAQVQVDGRGEAVTPATVAVGPGEHTIEVSSPGFSTWSRSITTGSRQELTLTAELRPLPGVVTIESTPSGAEVWVDGEHRGSTPWENELDGGGHVIELRLEGYRRQPQQVAVLPGQRSPLAITLEPTSGVLAIGVDAPDARLRIDGEERGGSPFSPLDLEPGRYDLELEAPGHARWAGSVDVLDSRATRVDVELPSRGGLRPGWFWSATTLTLATLVAGTALVLTAREELRAFDDDVAFITNAESDLLDVSERRQSGQDSFELASSLDVAGWVLIGVGGALAIASLILGLTTRFTEAPSRAEISLEDESDGVAVDSSGGDR